MASSAAITRRAFARHLLLAADALLAKRADLLDLGTAREVLVYSFGHNGKFLARQLRAAGVRCFIFDNAPAAVACAAADGFDVTADLRRDMPLIVAAAQNQLAILHALKRPAYSLVEGLYAFDLFSAYGRARLFADRVVDRGDALHDIYMQIDPDCRAEFLALLRFRASLDVRHLASFRSPMARMWVPPSAIRDIESFCDVGAYDGDTLIAMKAAFPTLASTLAVEPNTALIPRIGAVATRLGLANRTFAGLAWNRPARLDVRANPDGMMVVTEDAAGSVAADTLDRIAGSRAYDYIKFDVEASEIAALDGARALLRAARCIAVASYHVPDDLLDIPNHLRDILGQSGPAWRCAFHHHSECFDDSIFYFYRTG